jgi:peptidoglycan hydrolase-like protein with peptidoglycan-binding domain
MTEAIAEIKEVVDDTAKADTQNNDAGGSDKGAGDDKAKETTDTGTVDTTTAESTGTTDAATDKTEEDKGTALPDNWRELAAGDNEDQLKLLKRYGSLNGVVKALQEAQNTIRSGKIKRDMPDPKDEKAMAEWRKEQGIPADPTGYVLPEPVTKRLVDADKPVLSSFTEFAHTKNAPPAFVEMAAEWYVDMSERAAEAQTQADTKASEEAEDALRDAWSRDEYKGNLTLAKRFMSSAGDIGDAWTEARLPDGRRLGDIPGFVQWASDQGRNAFGDVVFSSTDAQERHESRRAEIEKTMQTDIDKYYSEGMDKEYAQILERDSKRK